MPTTLPNESRTPEKLAIHFQPIVSLKQKLVVGVEALARPKEMSVTTLFERAKNEGQRALLELDRLCRRRALEDYGAWSPVGARRPLLFLNFEASIIDDGVVGSGALSAAVREAGHQPNDVVIEINESKVMDTAALRRFVDQHRALGFLIALDDLGAGHSNLPRIAQLKPHIIKLDRGLVQGIEHDYFKQETMKSLAGLGHRIGCMVLAEGVETPAEVEICASLGAELFQGYHFCRPQAPNSLDLVAMEPSMQRASRQLRENAVRGIQSRRLESTRITRLSEDGRQTMAQAEDTHFEPVLSKLLRSDLSIECAYLLDKNGLQVTETITGPTAPKARNRLFAPAPKGADHSNKEYFFGLFDAGLERFTTETYLSLATGRLCRTVAVMVPHSSGANYVLCLDLVVQA